MTRQETPKLTAAQDRMLSALQEDGAYIHWWPGSGRAHVVRPTTEAERNPESGPRWGPERTTDWGRTPTMLKLYQLGLVVCVEVQTDYYNQATVVALSDPRACDEVPLPEVPQAAKRVRNRHRALVDGQVVGTRTSASRVYPFCVYVPEGKGWDGKSRGPSILSWHMTRRAAQDAAKGVGTVIGTELRQEDGTWAPAE